MDSNELGETRLSTCWCCGAKMLRARIENHHVLGKATSDLTLPLCVLCHDLVDRIPLEHEEIFEQYFLNCYADLLRMGDEFKWTKIFLLKLFKLGNDLTKRELKDKQKECSPPRKEEENV